MGVDVGVVVVGVGVDAGVVDLVLLELDDDPEDLVVLDELLPGAGVVGVDAVGVATGWEKVKLALGKTPFQTLLPLVLSISELVVDPVVTGVIIICAGPLAITVKVIWAIG
jgi:hypothetical protein